MTTCLHCWMIKNVRGLKLAGALTTGTIAHCMVAQDSLNDSHR